ncbi:YhcH/YjgK/YiaL family protein [Alloprevotella sp. oral taxon 473]|uniref:YhcH/YjgK/YiaL family protein n=1 Tax=Alloprevotella sp. oral taxon 473 TaxID=712469 RepID=UPI0002A2EDDE|nr:YhcH/YjgK/YiaL family protein [Alloprevotella sp. oral taxon 473]EKX88341.1 YhcH/YjgK/YiaL family protein [Alloprevotella sp. oral taxon 473 str. F0040]
MILAHLNDSDRYVSLHPLFKQLFDYVKAHDFTHVPAERIVLDGDRLFINVADVTLKSPEEQVLEVHRRYIDVHFPLSREEIMGWSSLSVLATESMQPFNEGDDFAVYAERAQSYLTIHPGEFAIVWPEDAHAPIIGQGALRKLIAKVCID